MTKQERFIDIENRHSLVLAERNIIPKGTENYITLSTLAEMIIDEIPKVIKARREEDITRYGFRLNNTKYQIVELYKTEKY